MERWRLFASWVLVATPCSWGCTTGSTGTDAVVATAITVAAVGVNRVLTRECWAACSPGYVCNQERGLCVPGECAPACVEPSQCMRVKGELSCVTPQLTWVHGAIPPGPGAYAPNADADLANKKASVPPRTGATTPASYAGRSEQGETMFERRAGCELPGSEEWYQKATEPASSVGSVFGELHRDLVGVWSTPQNALGGSKAVVITPAFVIEGGARSYDVLGEDGQSLLLRAHPPLPGVASSEFGVRFASRDRIDFGGRELERYDCRVAGPHAQLCCRLPRARWVALGPR